MLTSKDLGQIRKVVHEEIQAETPKIVRDIIQTETPKIVRVESENIIKRELKPIKADIVKIRKDMKTIVNFFDREYLDLRQRVDKIEEHLGLFSSN